MFNCAKIAFISSKRMSKKIVENAPTLRVFFLTFFFDMSHPIVECAPKATIFFLMKPFALMACFLAINIFGTIHGLVSFYLINLAPIEASKNVGMVCTCCDFVCLLKNFTK